MKRDILTFLSAFNKPSTKILPQLKNDTGKTLIQTVSKSGSTPTTHLLSYPQRVQPSLQIQLQCPVQKN
ncbi:hypothetical protein [Methanobacterium paludis]|uniref:hypothetical protein n=1 Tax=Methanobacterium paludis (strain DSM 25820 / JCM 18151 / SWAN1) TaxID=868131 RepID=UPI00064E5501|nr:hypothetical protein [Methanobacterium paludis]